MRFMMLLIALAAAPLAQAAFTIDDNGKALTVLENGQPVLVYHYTLVPPPKNVPEKFRRACYIHPLYGLDGEVMTQDFPLDHFHHRGVFWAWPLCTVGEKSMDVWALEGVRQMHEKWLAREAGETAEIAIQNVWVYDDAPNQPQVRETIRMVIQPADQQSRAIDFDMKFENVSQEVVTFLGAANKGYGGLCIRPDAARKPMTFTTAQGVLKEDALRVDTPWADVSYPVKPDGPTSGIAIFEHPSVPGYPFPGWIMRHYSFLGVSWPHETSHALQPGESFTLRYRMLVHRGGADDAKVAEAFNAYTEKNK